MAVVKTNPASPSENVIQATADVPDLTLRPFSDAQTSPILRVQNAAGTVDRLVIRPQGEISNPGAGGLNSEQFGAGAAASGPGSSSAFGAGSEASGANGSSAFGSASGANGQRSTALGSVALAIGDDSIAIGVNSEADGIKSIAIGNNTNATATLATCVGADGLASAVGATALGQSARASGLDAIAIGHGSHADHPGAIVLGAGVSSSAPNQCVFPSALLWGFFGAPQVGQQVGASAAGIALIGDPNAKAAIQALQTALANLGFVTSPA